MKLKKIIYVTGTIECITGLTIKGMNSELHIGGADSEVIKNPLTNSPYIPGSSLKGKIRSQLERKYEIRNKDKFIELKKPCGCGEKTCMICTIFGAYNNANAPSAPTRIIVRDGVLTEKFKNSLEKLPTTQSSYMEVKPENIVKRDTGAAESPRFIERVPAGAEFTMEILLQIFEGDDGEKMLERVKEGLDMVEQSYLGGSGSRGYGQVKFRFEVQEKEV